MDETLLIVLVIIAIVVFVALAYTFFCEARYRRQTRKKLQEIITQSAPKTADHAAKNKPVLGEPGAVLQHEDLSAPLPAGSVGNAKGHAKSAMNAAKGSATGAGSGEIKTAAQLDVKSAAQHVLASGPHNAAGHYVYEKKELPGAKISGKTLLNLREMASVDLAFFDKRFDYVAYVALTSAQPLINIPRFSEQHQVRVVGCAVDDRYQIVEPVPGVMYQGFAIGLQAVSRQGLATIAELDEFGAAIKAFAEALGGDYLLSDVSAFLKVARELDGLCERVDHCLSIHLIAREKEIAGPVLRQTLEAQGFVLASDGTFVYPNEEGEELYRLVALNQSGQVALFTPTLLETKHYKGFSLLFDIPKVPKEEEKLLGATTLRFDEFMGLVVNLSRDLGLVLVDDRHQLLNPERLEEIRHYVIERREEMVQAAIPPGSKKAHRLFS